MLSGLVRNLLGAVLTRRQDVGAIRNRPYIIHAVMNTP